MQKNSAGSEEWHDRKMPRKNERTGGNQNQCFAYFKIPANRFCVAESILTTFLLQTI